MLVLGEEGVISQRDAKRTALQHQEAPLKLIRENRRNLATPQSIASPLTLHLTTTVTLDAQPRPRTAFARHSTVNGRGNFALFDQAYFH